MPPSVTQAQSLVKATGFHVFPCDPATGRPGVKWRDASTADLLEVERLWAPWGAGANIGIDCGKSGLVVVDIDFDSGGTLEAVKEIVGNTHTLTARTRSGLHLYYSGSGVRNSVSALAQGVDVRGEGGFVFAPPSVSHKDGTSKYRWETRGIRPAPVPEGLLVQREQPRQRSTTGRLIGATPWGLGVFERQVGRLAQTNENTHNRNETLFKAAASVWGCVETGELPADAIEKLAEVARSTGLDDREIQRTLESACQRAEPLRPSSQHYVPMPKGQDQRQLSRMTITEIENLPPPKWIVDGVLPEGLTVLHGKEGSGKSLWAIHYTLEFASQGGPVVYIAGEGVAGLSPRVKSWLQHNEGKNPGDNWQLIPEMPDMTRMGDRQNLFESLVDNPPKLLVLDTWGRAMAGGDELSAQSVGPVVHWLDRLREEFGTSVLILHHSNAEGGERGRQLRRVADCMWKIVTPAWDSGERPFLWNEKMKDHETVDKMDFVLRQVGDSVVFVPRHVQ